MYGTGTSDDPYIVYTAQELYDIRAGGATPGSSTTHYRQGNDIYIPTELAEIWCLGTNAEKTYIFASYRGDGHTISGLNFNHPSVDNVGLFPLLPSSSKKIISNLGVKCDLVGGDNVGGLCGNNNSSSSGAATISNCYVTGSVSGTSNVGGLCGNNSGAYRSGAATISNCYATGSVSGTSNVGGLCGNNNSSSSGSATISNCYATGSVSGTSNVGGLCGNNSGAYSSAATISNCYATGSVSGTSNVGGLCGNNSSSSYSSGSATISNCYVTGSVSGTSNVGGLCGNNSGYSGKTNAMITGCFALNPKIIRNIYTTELSFGRVVGKTANHTLSNYALETMLFYPDGDA